MSTPLWISAPKLYNTATRLGLRYAMVLLRGSENEANRVRALYRCRVNGLSVIVQSGSILVNGLLVLPEDLDDPETLLKRAAPGGPL